MAFSTMQPNIKYFDVTGIGYIAYTCHWGIKFVLSDPICDSKHLEIILNLFVQKFPRALFVQVSKSIVDILHRKHSYYGTQCGSESKVPLNDWNLRGKKKNIIRTAVNQAKIQGIEIKEGQFKEQTKKISESWIHTRRRKNMEIRFLIRPMRMDYNEGIRYFYAYQNNEPIGFVFFDPIYRHGKTVAYVPNISRSCTSFKQGLWYLIMAHAMEKFKAEGIEYIDLGIMPMKRDNDFEDQESTMTRLFIQKVYDWGNFIYNFKGLEFAKSRFHGKNVKVFYCHYHPFPIISILAMSRMSRLI